MHKIELLIKHDEKTFNDIAEKIDLASNTNILTKEGILQKLIGKDVVKTKMIKFLDNCLYKMQKN